VQTNLWTPLCLWNSWFPIKLSWSTRNGAGPNWDVLRCSTFWKRMQNIPWVLFDSMLKWHLGVLGLNEEYH
jgi:hypothetical protein